MPEYLSPGVYVEEVDTGSKPIEGVSTSTTGMIGVAERGPVDVPILITGLAEYSRWFGDRLDPVDFSSPATGPHYHLPIAVDGFFTNGGKRLYVTRVLDAANARRSLGMLFDRGTAASANTRLLRRAGEVTGTIANPPPLYLLDATDITSGPTTNADNWIRVGDGSDAEYQQVTGAPDELPDPFGHVSLNLPLLLAHDAAETAEAFARTATGGLGAGFTFAIAAQPGDRSITIQGADADVAALAALALPLLVEIGPANAGEHRFVTARTIETVPGPTDRAALDLDQPLALPHAVADAVTPLDTAPILNAAALGIDAAGGDRLIYLDDRAGNFDTVDNVVVVNNANATRREVRRIGALRQLTLDAGAYESYPDGTIAQGVTIADDQRAIVNAAPAVGDRDIQIGDVRGLVPGQNLLVGPAGPTQEPAAINTITPTNPAAPLGGTLRLNAPLANAHAVGEPVTPAPTALTAAVAAGAMNLPVANRVGLNPGSVVRVGPAPGGEFLRVRAIPNPAPSGSAADPGEVITFQQTTLTHLPGAVVALQGPPAPLRRPTALVLPVARGETTPLVTDGTGYAAGDVVRITTPANEVFFHGLNAVSAAPPAAPLAIAAVTLGAPLLRSHPASAPVAGRAPLFEVQALDPGAWGDRLRVAVEDEATGLVAGTDLRTIVNPTTVRLGSATGVERGTVLELSDAAGLVDDPVKVASVDRASGTLQLATPLTAAQQTPGLRARSREFRLTVYLLRQPDPAQPSRNDQAVDFEEFRWLSMDPRHSRYFETVIGSFDVAAPIRRADRRPEGASWYVRVRDTATGNPAVQESVRLGPETLTDRLPNGTTRAARHRLERVRGFDAIATIADAHYVGLDGVVPETRTGLQSLRNEEEISLVAAPGRTSAQIQLALINHCEAMRYRFAVLDSDVPQRDSLNDVQFQRQQYDTKYAALYYPWLLIPNPFPGVPSQPAQLPIPPSGHVLGVYARTDIERGVHKAPANEVVRGGIVGLRRTLNKAEHDILDPSPVNINVIRDFRPNNRGIRIWGARVVTSDPDWKYVNVRRLLIFIERSIELGLQWVVFEPNAEPLWARVRQTIRDFLTVVWRNGALEGTKPEEAFYVKCDRTTMTQTDIDNGRLIVLVGVAPVKPAEFVIVRIGLWTAHAEQRAEG